MAGTDTTETRTPLNSFILTEEGTNMFPWATELASQYSATPSELANGQNTILTNGETYFPPEAVEEIGVDTLNYMNNKPREGGHAAIDRVIAMTTLQGLRPMNEGGEVMPNYAGGGMVQDQMPGYRYGGMTKKKKMMGYENGGEIVSKIEGLLSNFKGPFMYDQPMGSQVKSDAPLMEDQIDAPMIDMDAVLRKKLGTSFGSHADAISARNQRLKDEYGSISNAYDLLRSGKITRDVLNRERDAFREFGSKAGLLGMQQGGMVDDSLTGMMGGGMAMKKNMMGMQDGGMVDYQNGGEVSDSLYWANHPANNPEMNGGSLGVVREQATMLQDSMKVDTANKAKKALQLLKLKGLLEEGEAIEYQNPQRMMNPNMIPTPDEAEMMQNMMRRLSI